ncbi:hypothetical protein CCH79_00019396 [Gambusia affinis]|uniref:H15 domain-containing protein n=1 Tax=Gambusia affinis TaxID=33528 RepID=A0A315V840_GAMAF|nr:hypothetical protein CCH79_00019396 [Gambusia affinis]
MAEVAPAAAPAKAPAKAPKKKSATKVKKDGPSLPKLIVAAVADSKERKGVSLAALKKVLAGKGVDVAKANKRINTALSGGLSCLFTVLTSVISPASWRTMGTWHNK